MSTLVLLRHGESTWNKANKFTGWTDVPLSPKGEEEALAAGQKLSSYKFDKAYTSELIRAQQTLTIVLKAIQQETIPITKDKALNERHYGELQGLNKTETAKKFGAEQVHLWRRSYDIAPPGGESLKDTAERAIPYFNKHILTNLKKGLDIIVSAHGNSLRAIIMNLDKLSTDQVLKLELPTGVPVIYEFDKAGKILSKKIL
ncbi:2,3-diphosphoglycerate-dependent phosphoglycerate mutase [Candidatus Margulisiibacteriota bacterium]